MRPSCFSSTLRRLPRRRSCSIRASEANPRGLCNKSDQVGRNLMDHMYALTTAGVMPQYPADSYYRGRRPTGIYIPRFRNVTEEADGYVRGYGYQGGVMRQGGKPGANTPGIGQDIKRTRAQVRPVAHFHLGLWRDAAEP